MKLFLLITLVMCSNAHTSTWCEDYIDRMSEVEYKNCEEYALKHTQKYIDAEKDGNEEKMKELGDEAQEVVNEYKNVKKSK